MHDFRRLHVWQRARELFVAIDRLTRTFPRSDRGVVATQLRRAAFSIPNNIAEGCGKDSVKETLRFLQHAAGSIAETENQLIIATDLGYIHPKASDALIEQAVAIKRMLFRLGENLGNQGPNSGS
ncbi:MAG TPA: four helix bundle protein [Gemmatimonadaceae bacterium]